MNQKELALKFPQPSVAGVIYHEPTREVLIMRRTLTHYYMPGYWHFPGGMMNHGETIKEATIREAQEETGFEKLHYKHKLCINNDVNKLGAHWICFFGLLIPKVSYIPPNPEPEKHENAIWWSIYKPLPIPHFPGMEDAIHEIKESITKEMLDKTWSKIYNFKG